MSYSEGCWPEERCQRAPCLGKGWEFLGLQCWHCILPTRLVPLLFMSGRAGEGCCSSSCEALRVGEVKKIYHTDKLSWPFSAKIPICQHKRNFMTEKLNGQNMNPNPQTYLHTPCYPCLENEKLFSRAESHCTAQKWAENSSSQWRPFCRIIPGCKSCFVTFSSGWS